MEEDKFPGDVWITSSRDLAKICDLIPANRGRQTLVTTLLQAYGLDKRCKGIIKVPKVTRSELEKFHSKNYLDILLRNRESINQLLPDYTAIKQILMNRVFQDAPEDRRYNLGSAPFDPIKYGEELIEKHQRDDVSEPESESDLEIESEESDVDSESVGPCSVVDNVVSDIKVEESNDMLDMYGLRFDCSVFPFMSDYAKLVASSSIHTAKKVVELENEQNRTIAINWNGGRHHASKLKAAGFCYVNDIVIAINVLRLKYKKIFYLDLDLHHGDGVEAAFEFSQKVTTCSIHMYDIGFYPGTGSLESSGKHKINIPTRKGLSDSSMLRIVRDIVIPHMHKVGTDVIVMQVGVDGLATDDHKEWNMTIKGYSAVLKLIFNELSNVPIMIVGGGGYNHTETSKCWAYLTKTALGISDEKEPWDMLPEHEQLDSYHEDGFKFWTQYNLEAKSRKDENDIEYINHIKNYISNL